MNARHFYAGEEFDREHPPVALQYLLIDSLAELQRRSIELSESEIDGGGESPNNGAATDATATAPTPEPIALTKEA